MGEEIELAAKSTGAVVAAVIEASGVAKPIQELTDWLSAWMHPRLVASAAKQMEAAVQQLKRAGIRPGAVHDEQMRLLLEEGAREEDETLKTQWANLLANGLASGNDGVPRAYVEVLRQLEPDEVLTLDRMAAGTVALQGSISGTRMGMGNSKGVPLTGLTNLERLGLIQLGAPAPRRYPHLPVNETEMMRGLMLSSFGQGFVRACRAPTKPQAEASLDQR
jgi:hypothetical protein